MSRGRYSHSYALSQVVGPSLELDLARFILEDEFLVEERSTISIRK
jgi:hypothetical protein